MNKTKLVHLFSFLLKAFCIWRVYAISGGWSAYSHPPLYATFGFVSLFMALSAAKDLAHFFAHGK